MILLSWEDEDPRLPVSLEIRELADTFTQSYGFNVEEWLIPAEDCHNALQARILQFLGGNNLKHLKILWRAWKIDESWNASVDEVSDLFPFSDNDRAFLKSQKPAE